jgi:putative acetyltransferase
LKSTMTPPPMPLITIREDDLSGPEIHALLKAHLATMRARSPPESVHALGLTGLRAVDVTFWTVWQSEDLVGCGALKAMPDHHGEIKSMHTAAAHRGKKIAEAMLLHILAEAAKLGLTKLSLETGSQPGFATARALYTKHGFAFCGPFGDYREDPHSVFMTCAL